MKPQIDATDLSSYNLVHINMVFGGHHNINSEDKLFIWLYLLRIKSVFSSRDNSEWMI